MTTSGTNVTVQVCPTCPLCGSRGVSDYCSGAGDRRRKIAWCFKFYICKGCRLRFQVLTRDAALLYEHQEEAPLHQGAARHELRCDSDVLATFDRLKCGRRLLEIGSGDGRFLAAASQAGLHCIGVDVSAKLAAEARRRSGVTILVGDLRDLKLEAEAFDLINLDQVLMYVPDPLGLGKEVFRLLAPGGICRIREYDPDSFSAWSAGKKYWMYAPTHLLVWSHRSIQELASQSQLRISRIISGTEASLHDWLQTERERTLLAGIRCTVQFLLRKVAFGPLSVAADKVYYLKKCS